MSEEDINNLKEMLVDFNEYSTDYTKTRCKELEKTVENTLNEIDRLNNIINKLEKWLDKKEKLTFNSWNKGIHEVQRKLQELKESNK